MVGYLYQVCARKCGAAKPCPDEDGRRALLEKLPAHSGENRRPVQAQPQNQRPSAAVPPVPAAGPGTELKKLLKELGLKPSAGCDCNGRAARMDGWGVAGCLERRAEIVTWLIEEAGKASWGDWFRAAHAIAFKDWFRAGDTYGCIVDEAIRRAGPVGAA